MEYRRLGNSGLEVSPICLGTMMFGDRTDAAAAQEIVDAAFGAGINFIDTADVYTKGARCAPATSTNECPVRGRRSPQGRVRSRR